MSSAVATGRRRQELAVAFLGEYHAATTAQLGDLLWRGDRRLAARRLRQLVEGGLLRRLPHPLVRGGPYIYTRSDRRTSHSQQVLHQLAMVDLHIAITRTLGARGGVRIIPEMPWGPHLIPDQTVILRDGVWAVEHHLSGHFTHSPDYRQWIEEEAYQGRPWWREGQRIGLLVVTTARQLDGVRDQLCLHQVPGARVATTEGVLADPGRWLGEPKPLPNRSHR